MIDQQEKIKELEAKLVEEALRLSVPNELLAIGELLRTQDNRATDQPMFIVQQQVEHPCDEERDGRFESTRVVWYEVDGGGEVSPLRAERLGALNKGCRIGRKYSAFYDRCVMGMQYEYVTACFTEEGAKAHLDVNGHNLEKPRIYAMGSYRNFEFRAIRNWLMQLPQPAAQTQSAEVIDV